jgi:general transcription factor 3C polypeptide 2
MDNWEHDQELHKTKERKKGKSKEKPPTVAVASFDPCIDNHLRFSANYFPEFGRLEEGSGKFKSLERLQSGITFVRDWQLYCRYGIDSKLVKFACETKDSESKDNSLSAVMPQFSAAAVPQWDRGPANNPNLSNSRNDFVLNVGGSVWALDWCPRGNQGVGSQINCEYLAVGAHPPGCSYHKLGLPVAGKGVVQIWSIFNANLNVKAPLSKRQKVRGKKQMDKSEPDYEEDKVSTMPFLFKEPVVGQCSVPEPVEVPEKNVHEGSSRIELVEKTDEKGNLENIPTTVSIDCHYQEMTDNDAEWTAQKSRKRMKDKARSKVIDDTGVLVPENIVEKSESCMDIVAANAMIRKDTGSIGIRTKSLAAALAVDETSIVPTAEFGLPRMVLCLAHDGEIAWDVKWQPLTEKDLRNQHRLGFLAVLLGDGSMQVWEVPVPSAVNFLFTSSYARGGLDPRFVKLEPVFKCSKLQSGGRQSIPLTLEWSTSAPHDLLLAGCHDGMVALWKFSPKASSSQEARPLICFIADTLAIRALAWAPSDGDSESKNVIVTGGHGGSLRFWDLRDPFRPLWDLHLSRGIILSLDWLHEPRCIILSMDDGTLRLLSLSKAALDTPVTGRSFCGTQFQGLQSYYCSSFSIWSVQVSRLTGLVAYCSVDGSALHFQLTQKAVDKDKMRHRTPHYICGAFVEEGSKTFKVISPSTLTPVRMKKSLNEWSDTPRSIRGFLSESNQAIRANIQAADNKYMRSSSMELAVVSDADTITPSKSKITKKSKKTTSGKHSTADVREDMDDLPLVPSMNAGRCSSGVEGLRDMTSPIEKYPSKLVAVHRVRWNFNKGSERWLCYSGAAGIVRCQEITSVFTA